MSMIMLGKECRICRVKKATFELPYCDHAMCKRCWTKIRNNTGKYEAPLCPFCRRRQESAILKGFRELPWFVQGLVIFAVYKIIIG